MIKLRLVRISNTESYISYNVEDNKSKKIPRSSYFEKKTTELTKIIANMDAPMSVDRCKENAVKIVNSKFGDNIKSLSDLKSFYLETKQTTETIESRVSIINY